MLGIALVLLWVLTWAPPVHAECVVDTDSPTFVDGKRIDLRCNASGELITSGGGGGGAGDASLAEQQTQTGILTTIDSDTGTIAGAVKAEDGAHSSGHTGIPFWGVRNDSASTTLTDTNGDYTPIATDSNGRLFINTISAISSSMTPGTAAANLGKAEDAVHTTGDTGVFMLAVRDDSPAAVSGTDGDYEALHVNPEGGLWSTPTPSTQGGLSVAMNIDVDESEDAVKATAGKLYGWYMFNAASSTRYVKFYNDTVANVIVGTTVPTLTIPLPAGAAANVEFSMGIPFSSAITIAATTGVGTADTGAPGANEVIVNIFYK